MVWTRRMSQVMDPEEFTRCLLTALSEKAVCVAFGDIIADRVREEVAPLKKALQEKEMEISSLKTKVSSLETDLECLEQYTRRNSIRISGVRETGGEDVVEKAVELFNNEMNVSPPVSLEDIDRVHRVGPISSSSSHSGPRNILVKFATYRTRFRVMSQRRTLNNAGHALPIYLNEDLTRSRATLLYRARQLKQRGRINGCWTHDGTIVIKDRHNVIRYARTLPEAEKLLATHAQPQEQEEIVPQ